MYFIDANMVMNVAMAATLALGAVIVLVTVVQARRRRTGPAMSYLSTLSVLFVCFGIVVAVLGFRGRKSADPPMHFLLDMKYQPKYTPQGQSKFFADGRAARLPPEGTLPFDGTDYFADAGFHTSPKADFLQADDAYYHGIASRTAVKLEAGVSVPNPPTWENGKITSPGYFLTHIPPEALDRASADPSRRWESLITRGRHQFNVKCAACHGECGRGGRGDTAYGIVGAYDLSVAPADLTTGLFPSQPDGQLFNTISRGKGAMPGYGHQVKVQDRWAIVAYIRVLQYARQTHAAEKK